MSSSTMANRARRFFSTQKKGENFELKTELNHEDRPKRKEAVKKVIANMTIGKDVSNLFADVVKNMQTEDLELKKLVYLYLINYAKTQPELVILAVNTFVKDSDDPNPLIRALAIRTMGCLRVEKILAYLEEPLRKAIKDENPYVRKTAAICIAKLFDLSPTFTVENGYVNTLQDFLSDPNPMVVANAVAALSDIQETAHRKDAFVITNLILNKLLAALNECTEWGQICILGSLAEYKAVDAREAEMIIEKVTPRLQHANASVVLSAVKVLMVYMQVTQNRELEAALVKKMAPPLVTLLSSAAEIQYVALRNINLILQKRPDVLSQEMRVFFCKYNDPPYVKLEKLEVILKLVNDKNVEQVLSELKEYANEVDVDFVRKSVRAIGRTAIKIDSAAERCVNTLLDLIKTKVDYIVQEIIIVIKDVFRKYPRKYEGIIPVLCENLESLDEPEAKASLIWIIGEHADRIENANELLLGFLETFTTEEVQVQLQLVTATVKLLLSKPGSSQDLVQKVLQQATQECDNPDLRDRAYVYWRLLSTNPQAAKAIVLAEKPPIVHEDNTVSEGLLDELIVNIATIASVFHKSPALIGSKGGFDITMKLTKDEEEERAAVLQIAAAGMEGRAPPGIPQTKEENLLDLDFDAVGTTPGGVGSPAASSSPSRSGMDDLLDIMSSAGPMGGLGGGPGLGAPATAGFVFPKVSFLASAAGKGLEVHGTFARRQGATYLDLTLANHGAVPLSDFAFQFNKNIFGLVPGAPLAVPPIAPGASHQTSLLLLPSGPVGPMQPPHLLQMALKNNVDVFYFNSIVPVHTVFVEAPAVDAGAWTAGWADPAAGAAAFAVPGAPTAVADVEKRLRASNVAVVGTAGQTIRAAAKTPQGTVLLVEIVLAGSAAVTVKSKDKDLVSCVQISIEGILRG